MNNCLATQTKTHTRQAVWTIGWAKKCTPEYMFYRRPSPNLTCNMGLIARK